MTDGKYKPLLDLQTLTKPLISKLRYGLVALLLAGFLFADLYNLLYLLSHGQAHHIYHRSSIEKMILSLFGAELSMRCSLNVKTVFNLKNEDSKSHCNIQLFGFALCLLPVLTAVIQASFNALDHYLASFLQIPYSSAIIKSSHNIFTFVYSITAFLLLTDIALFFIREWYNDRKK